MSEVSFHSRKDSRKHPTISSGYFPLAGTPLMSDKSDMSGLLKRRVEERLAALRTNAFEAARVGELERNFVNDILIEKKLSVRGPNLLKLAKALRCSANYLISEDAPPPDDDDLLAAGVGEDVRSDFSPEQVSVPEYDVRASAGGGFIVDEERIKDVWQFSKRYLVDELRLRPRNLMVVEVEGDSMLPTLHSGDRILVDHSETNPGKDGIYVTWNGQATVVKRLEAIPYSEPPMVVLISDNKNHNAYTVAADVVRVVGRVVWYARRL